MQAQLLSQAPVCCQDTLDACVQPLLKLLFLGTLQLFKTLQHSA
jgi:hypothetical protein